jgi:glycosyltransferase involved in cell wall biosynthesis
MTDSFSPNSSRPRVALDARVLQGEDARRGMGHYTRGLIEALLAGAGESGFEYGLVTCRNRPAPDLAVPPDTRILEICEPFPPGPRARFLMRRAPWLAAWSWRRLPDSTELRRAVGGFGASLLHVFCPLHGPFHWSPPHGLATVATVYDLIPLAQSTAYLANWPTEARLRYLWRLRQTARLPLLFAISKSVKSDIVEWLRVAPERIEVVYPGVRFADAAAEPGNDGRTYPTVDGKFVLAFFSVNPSKNSDCLLRAWAALPLAARKDRMLRLVCPDDSETRSALERCCVELGIRASVDVRVNVNDVALTEHYRRAGLFVIPSLAEGFGLPALEAARQGAPVLASELPVLREILAPNAFFFDPSSSNDLARKLQEAFESPALLAKYAIRGLERGKFFTWSAAARATTQAYRRVIFS